MNIDILLVINLVLVAIMLTTAVYAVHAKSMKVAVIAAGAVSLTASIIYLLLGAPDVAMTEASIGSGLSTIIFFYVLNRTRRAK